MAKDPLTDLQDRLTVAEKQIKELQTALGINTDQVIVVSYKEIPLKNGESDVEYTYSDGTKQQLKHKRINLKGAFITDGAGEGKWQETIEVTALCDDRVLGHIKS